MNNLTRDQLKEGYIQQQVVGDYRITLQGHLHTFAIETEELFTNRYEDDVEYFIKSLTEARKEFKRQVSRAMKIMKEGEL